MTQSQNSQINHTNNVQTSLCRGPLCIYTREVGPHVYKDPQQTVDSHSPPCVAWPRGQNCRSYLSHKQKHNIILKCDPRPQTTKDQKKLSCIWAKQLTAYFLCVCSTGAGPHAADGYHWTRGPRAEQARRGAHTLFIYPYTNYCKYF